MRTDTIKIIEFTTYRGKNIYSHRPVMKMVVDLGDYYDTPTKDIDGFNEKLLNAFPGLKTNCCGLGYEGGFLEKLNNGTYLAHVLEHVILETQFMLGYNVRYGKTRLLRQPSEYYLVYEYENEICGLECGKAGVYIINSFINQRVLDIPGFLDYLSQISLEGELGPSTGAIVNEAKKRGIPVTRIGNESLVRLGYGKNSRLIESTLIDSTSCISADISCNKQLTKSILSEHHIPVPYGKVVYSEISAVITANQIGMPVVVKPFDGNQGKGVYLNLDNEADVAEAFRQGSKISKGIIVENYIEGKDYRVLVVGNKVSAVSERIPAMVTGDGQHTIRELVDIINHDKNRGNSHEKSLTKIKLDDISLNILKKLNMTADSVPKTGQAVKLRENGNISTGGTAIDCTDLIHPENAELAVLAASAIGVDIAGIDIVSTDISKSILETGGAIVEVNTAPGIRMHIHPSAGQPRNVACDIVDYLFSNHESYHFPIISVTGTNGKTTTVRLISHVLSCAGNTVGMTSTSGTFIGNKCICKGDNSGPRSARTLLSNKLIDCAVLETARGGILREGLGYDAADVGVILNITEDHLGIDGIETLEDLAFVKSLVTEAVSEGGYVVLNAEDRMTPYFISRTKAKIILFSVNPVTDRRYISDEYILVYAEDGLIKIFDNNQLIYVTAVEDIPITNYGRIECNIENSLAATAALYAMKIPVNVIAQGLRTFNNNVGRFNLYSLGNFHVMLDYGHNLAGYEQVIKACKSMGYTRLVGIIGMPGDRSNYSIKSVGKFCSENFDKIYIKEDIDKRGRDSFEVADLFYKEIIYNGFQNEISIIENELDCLKKAVSNANNGDLIVVFYESLEPLRDYLLSIGGKLEYKIKKDMQATV